MSARTKPTDACCGSSRQADGAIRQCLLASEIQKHLVWGGRDKAWDNTRPNPVVGGAEIDRSEAAIRNPSYWRYGIISVTMDDIGRPAISKEELYTAAVGERAARYYVPKFLAFEEGTKRFSFNVWALLFGAFWFCYRRMWISAMVLWIGGAWLVGFLTSTTLLGLGLSKLTTPIISIVSALYVGIILPVFANYLYYSSVGQRIAHLREKFVDDADALSALKSRSPVSWVALAVLALLVVAGRLLQPSFSQNQASESYVRAAMEQTTTLRTAVVKSYQSACLAGGSPRSGTRRRSTAIPAGCEEPAH